MLNYCRTNYDVMKLLVILYTLPTDLMQEDNPQESNFVSTTVCTVSSSRQCCNGFLVHWLRLVLSHQLCHSDCQYQPSQSETPAQCSTSRLLLRSIMLVPDQHAWLSSVSCSTCRPSRLPTSQIRTPRLPVENRVSQRSHTLL